MTYTQEAMNILVALLPGFLFVKVFALRTSVGEYKPHILIVDALLVSLVVTGIAASFPQNYQPSSIEAKTLINFCIAILIALIWSEVINRDWLSKFMQLGKTRLSSQHKIYPIVGVQELQGKWHLMRMTSGVQFVGFLSWFDSKTHEALFEDAQQLGADGVLEANQGTVYVPSGDHIEFIKTIGE